MVASRRSHLRRLAQKTRVLRIDQEVRRRDCEEELATGRTNANSRVAEALYRTAIAVGREGVYPKTIRVDQGSEFVSRDLDVWVSIGMQKGPPIGVQKGPPRGTAEQAASEARPWRRSERAACGRVSDSGQERFLKRQLSLPVSTMSQ